jgi:hypothetical protein
MRARACKDLQRRNEMQPPTVTTSREFVPIDNRVDGLLAQCPTSYQFKPIEDITKVLVFKPGASVDIPGYIL